MEGDDDGMGLAYRGEGVDGWVFARERGRDGR